MTTYLLDTNTSEALARLKKLKAPIAPIEKMLEESVAGRYT